MCPSSHDAPLPPPQTRASQGVGTIEITALPPAMPHLPAPGGFQGLLLVLLKVLQSWVLPRPQSCAAAIAGETRLLSTRGATVVPKHPHRACSQHLRMDLLPEHPPLLPPAPHAWVWGVQRQSEHLEPIVNREPVPGQRMQCSLSQPRRRGWRTLQGTQPGRSWPPAAPEHHVLLQMVIRTAVEVVQTSGSRVHASAHGP